MAKPSLSNPYRQPIAIKIDEGMTKMLEFTFLPDYARFLYENKLQDLSLELYRISNELRIPLLSHFAHYSREQLLEYGERSLKAVLSALASNQAVEYIEQSVLNWMNNNIPELSRNRISPEDISRLSFIRGKLFRDALPSYTRDQQLSMVLMEEVNAFTSIQDSVAIHTLLNMQQDLYDQAQHIAHIGNWSMDLTTNEIAWSKELFRIYEMEPQNSSPDLTSFNHPEDAEMIKMEIRNSRETGLPHDFYYRIILPDGREKSLHAIGQVQMNEKGEAVKIFGTLQDVTSLKKIEKEHREKELFIEKITELTPSVIAVYHIKTGRYLFINQAIQYVMGYHPEKAMEKGTVFFMEIMHPDDLQRILAENQRAIESANQKSVVDDPDEIHEFIYRMKHANGQWRWFQTFGTVFERGLDGMVETVINVSIDITEQRTFASKLKQNAEEIRKQEDRYYKMIAEVEDYAILLLSTEGIVQNWNSGAEKIKGYKANEIIGRNFRIFYPPEDQESGLPEKLIREAAQKGKASHEGWRIRKDKTRFWGNIVITALHDNQGGVIGFSKVTRDLTQMKLLEDDRKRYTRELEKKNLELEQKNKDLESFSYIASHDLQEPIRKIQIWANRIEESEAISDGTKDSLDRIQKACSRMQKLIKGILQYSQTDFLQVPRELTDLDEVLDEVLSDLSETLEEKQILIEKDHLPSLHIVRLQFVQLFSNIISNAVKYSSKELPPKIKITCSLESEGTELSGVQNAFYVIRISDNGIGFMQEYENKMFELFGRLESSPGYSGTGIGLAICKKIVRNHQGTITAIGEPGKGAVFTIRLPVT
jgi:PAS domain S-box-containing protein